jgi:hypothetical protein
MINAQSESAYARTVLWLADGPRDKSSIKAYIGHFLGRRLAAGLLFGIATTICLNIISMGLPFFSGVLVLAAWTGGDPGVTWWMGPALMVAPFPVGFLGGIVFGAPK